MSTSQEIRLSIEEVKEINKLQFFAGFNSIFYKDNNQKSYIEQAHNELGDIPEKPYISSKFEKFTSDTGEIKDMFHTSDDKIPYEINLNFIIRSMKHILDFPSIRCKLFKFT